MNAVIEESISNIVEFNEFEAQLVVLEKDYGTRVYDLTDPLQDKAARSDRMKVAKTITALETARKSLKSEAQERVKLVDGEGKKIRDRLETVKTSIKDQIDKHELAIQAHAEMLQSRVELIRSLGEVDDVDITSDSYKARLEECKGINVDDSFEDRKADATLAQVETVKKLEGLLEARLKYEAEQAELEKLRQEQREQVMKILQEKEEQERADREEKIRLDAETKAKQEVEDEAKRKVEDAQRKQLLAQKHEREANEKAEQERKKLIDDALKAETVAREKIQQEQREQEAKETAERLAEEAKKAKKEHRAKIHTEAKQCLVDSGYDDATATNIVKLIRDGAIKNISINY